MAQYYGTDQIRLNDFHLKHCRSKLLVRQLLKKEHQNKVEYI